MALPEPPTFDSESSPTVTADFRQETALSSVADRPLLDIWRTDVQAHRRRHVEDFGALYPGEGHSFCGFGYLLDSRTLSNGPHTIDVVAFDNAAHSAVLGRRSINVVNHAARRASRIALTPVG